MRIIYKGEEYDHIISLMDQIVTVGQKLFPEEIFRIEPAVIVPLSLEILNSKHSLAPFLNRIASRYGTDKYYFLPVWENMENAY